MYANRHQYPVSKPDHIYYILHILQITSTIFNLAHKNKKKKMKPTNPNADTYVEGERQYLSHFLPDIVVGHPDMI